MSSNFEELKSNWENSKKSIGTQTANFDDLYKMIKSKERANYFFYYGTITTLFITFIVISFFFYYVAPVRETLSRIGAGLMVLGLLFRILIEIISVYKAKRINNLDSTLKTAENTINFHQFRKSIHQIVSPIIIGLYTIGFYMITPEFSLHMKFSSIVLINISYLVIGVFLFIVIRKGVKKEMRKLTDIMNLRNELIE
ncbi:MAG TPA: hypothetical protein DG754_10285 [Bacteroidales bacterium]|jgi:hypothetical protein|nr:hypothetical protein [Bacteroidales bacterium]